MKKKHLKTAAFFTALGLIGFIGYFANGLLGNPISKMMAKNTATQYLEEQYPDTDYYIDTLKFNFKDTCYNAHIRSKTSMDTAFTCYINMFGTLEYDSYESDVKTHYTTARRIENEYRELTDTLLNSPSFPYKGDIMFGTLEIATGESIAQDHPYEVAPYSLRQEELELDKLYDIRKLGEKAGHLIIYLEDTEVTLEHATAIMLDIKQQFDDANIPFAAMDFSLSSPKNENNQDTKSIEVAHFLYKDIYKEGMLQRVKDASEKLYAYYAQEDAKNAK